MNYANDPWNNVTKYLNMNECHKLQVSKDFKKIYQNKYNMRKLKEKYFINLKDNWVRNNPNSVNVKILSLREYISNLKVESYSEFQNDDVNDINEEKLSIYFNIYKTSVKQMKKLLLEKIGNISIKHITILEDKYFHLSQDTNNGLDGDKIMIISYRNSSIGI